MRQSLSESTATLPTVANSTPEKRRGSKGPCLCGCTGGLTALWRKRLSASPELEKVVDQGVKSMVEKAQHVKKSGRQLYSNDHLFLADGRSTLEIIPSRREIRPTPTIASEIHHARLQTLMQTLQGPGFFLDSGSYPSSCQWTSTLLTTLVIDYSHLTGDHQYLSHIVALFNKQEVPSLLKQKNDDKLWVVLTYLRGAAYASTHDQQWVQPFLDRALLFYNSASAGWDESTCGGGMYWGPRGWCWSYKNAVTTELWITASVGMYEAFGDESMLEAAIRGWVWFEKSGMINDQGLINDGLDRHCRYLSGMLRLPRNNGKMIWTYNQGIVLSGLSRLYKHTEDSRLIEAAQDLIDSVIASPLVPTDSGVLVESCDPSRTCDQDQWMFKGVFFEHLGYFLADIASLDGLDVPTRRNLLEKYSGFIAANAYAVWDVARGEDGKVGNWWAGPCGDKVQRQVSVETHGSGVAAVCCAVRLNRLLDLLDIRKSAS